MASFKQLRMALLRRLEARVLFTIFYLFRMLPLDLSSAIGGWLGRTVGPRIALSRRARRNLQRFMPQLDAARHEEIIREMWDNFGRLATEMPHLDSIKVLESDPIPGPVRVESVGVEHMKAAMAAGRPIIFFTAHMGNWEIGPLMTRRHGLPLQVIYRPANNRHADQLFVAARRNIVGSLIPKGAEGARQTLRVLQEGKSLGLFLDQKMNDGIPAPFFGVDAMTSKGFAQLALRFNCVILPAWVERLGGAHFRVIVDPPLDLPNTGDRHEDIRLLTAAANRSIESWVRKRPGQWLWLHRRWPE